MSLLVLLTSGKVCECDWYMWECFCILFQTISLHSTSNSSFQTKRELEHLHIANHTQALLQVGHLVHIPPILPKWWNESRISESSWLVDCFKIEEVFVRASNFVPRYEYLYETQTRTPTDTRMTGMNWAVPDTTQVVETPRTLLSQRERRRTEKMKDKKEEGEQIRRWKVAEKLKNEKWGLRNGDAFTLLCYGCMHTHYCTIHNAI